MFIFPLLSQLKTFFLINCNYSHLHDYAAALHAMTKWRHCYELYFPFHCLSIQYDTIGKLKAHSRKMDGSLLSAGITKMQKESQGSM